jgi:hypothetical protein
MLVNESNKIPLRSQFKLQQTKISSYNTNSDSFCIIHKNLEAL